MKNIIWVVFCLVGAGLFLFSGCSSETKPEVIDYVDGSITHFNQLGFLGAAGHGATRSITIPPEEEGGETCYPGGMVIRELEKGSLLASAGLEVGDVIVKGAGDFLPDKEDPSLDLMKRLEAAITAGKTSIELGYLRKGEMKRVSLAIDPEALPPLAPGSMERCDRYDLAAREGLDYLKGCQQDDGTFPIRTPGPDANLAMTSMAGLAFLAGRDLGGAADYQACVDQCMDFVKTSLEGDVGAMGAAHAMIFIAEYFKETNDLKTMSTLMGAMTKIMEGQQDDGGWRLAGEDAQVNYCERTLATSCCLQALGMMSRNTMTMSGEGPSPMEKACAFLKEQTNQGDVGFVPDMDYDKRSDAGRLAHIMVALQAISCPFTDSYMNKLFKYYEENAEQIAQAPVPEALYLYTSALLSRQKDIPQWCLFNQRNQILLLSLQKTDGSFAALPKHDARPIPFFHDLEGYAWRTALYTLVCLLQDDTLPVLTAAETGGMKTKRDSDGKILEGGMDAMPDFEGMDMPEGAYTIELDNMEDLDALLEKLGVDKDNVQIQTITSTGKKEEDDG